MARGVRRTARWATVAAICACATLGAATTASAITQVGQTGFGNLGCDVTAIYGDSASVYAMPSAGTVTTFFFSGNSRDDGMPIDFLVLRPTGTAGNYTTVGRSGTVALGDGFDVFSLAVPILVNAGDILAQYGNAPGCASLQSGLSGLEVGGPGDPAVGDAVGLSAASDEGNLNEAAFLNPSTPLHAVSNAAVQGPTLISGQKYTIAVRGTFSPYKAILMSGGVRGWIVCGDPEPAPAYGTGDAVGSDAEYVFARPQSRRCDPHYAFPHKYGANAPALKFDLGSGFQRLVPDDPAYNAAHTYTYSVTGQGQPLNVELLDSAYADNYGDLEIDVWPTA